MKKYQPFFIVFAVAVILRFPYLDFVQIWDGYTYVNDCLRKAFLPSLNVSALNCFDHPSAAYTLLFFVPFTLLGFTAFAVNLVNLLILAGTAIFFMQFIECYLKQREESFSSLEKTLVGTLFVANPFFQANTLHLNVDIGIFFYHSFLLFTLFAGHLRWAALAGLGLLFSKETGTAVFGLTLAFWLYSTKKRSEYLQEGLKVAALPVLGMTLYLVNRHLKGKALFWDGVLGGSGSSSVTGSPASFLSFLDGSSLSFYSWIFVVNFHWVMTAVCVFAFVQARRKNEVFPHKAVLGYLLVMALVLTRIKVFTNSRYFFPAQSLLLVCSILALRQLVSLEKKRLWQMGALSVVFALSCFRTIDPISKKIFGTFNFGSQSLLNATSLSGECCGYGRDQIVYNLEFSKFGSLQNQIFAQLKPTNETTFLLHPLANWHLTTPIDPRGWKRTYAQENVVKPRYLDLSELKMFGGAVEPHEFYLLVFPFVQPHEQGAALQQLQQVYGATGVQKVEQDGYVLQYVHFTKRDLNTSVEK